MTPPYYDNIQKVIARYVSYYSDGNSSSLPFKFKDENKLEIMRLILNSFLMHRDNFTKRKKNKKQNKEYEMS